MELKIYLVLFLVSNKKKRPLEGRFLVKSLALLIVV